MSKKKFLIVFVTFGLVFFQVSSGARLAPGSVPQTRPLQPLPADVAPNLSKNINSANEVNQEIPQLQSPIPSETKKIPPAGEIEIPRESSSDSIWIIVAGAAGILLVYFVFRLKKPKGQSSSQKKS